MPKKFKQIPKFKTEAEERKFWQTHSSVDFVDWSKAERVSFPNLQLTNKPVTVRLPLALIDRLKIKAKQYKPTSRAPDSFAPQKHDRKEY